MPKRIARQKFMELEKISDVIDKQDAHYGFYLLKNSFSMPKLLYSVRMAHCLRFILVVVINLLNRFVMFDV